MTAIHVQPVHAGNVRQNVRRKQFRDFEKLREVTLEISLATKKYRTHFTSVDEDPLYSVTVKIKKIDLTIGPDLLNLFSDSCLEFEVTSLSHVLASTFTSSRVEGTELT
jgi:hypothetical protein